MLRAAVQGRLRLVDYLARVSLPAGPSGLTRAAAASATARASRASSRASAAASQQSALGFALLGKGVPLIGSALTRQQPAGTRDGVGLVGEDGPGRYASEGEGRRARQGCAVLWARGASQIVDSCPVNGELTRTDIFLAVSRLAAGVLLRRYRKEIRYRLALPRMPCVALSSRPVRGRCGWLRQMHGQLKQ